MKDKVPPHAVLATLALVSFPLGLLVSFGAKAPESFDPLERARRTEGRVDNREASVPSMCYTKTDGVSNPCWTCHTDSPDKLDYELQEEYAFSEFALTNRWANLFADRSKEAAAISDEEMFRYIRADNYTPLRLSLKDRADYPGYKPDLDLQQGFDREGFAADRSGWRAIRYKPFLGTFWPTNGSTDDVFIRLPAALRPTREIAKINLAILEAAVAAPPSRPAGSLDWVVEPLDESAGGIDLDGDGWIGGRVERIRALPTHYVGGVPVVRFQYPEGTEFLHSVRYVDPDSPNRLSARMKELRYSRKLFVQDDWALNRTYEKEIAHKEEGRLPVYTGSAMVGLRNDFGWLLQGFIEDARGRLRLQTDEEHTACMGCHGGIGVTVDQTFTLSRKLPGHEGWRPQDLRRIPDVPQWGHRDPEIVTYLNRVKGGDEFRANDEIASRRANHDLNDISVLLFPSRERAIRLNKAYMALVREQTFELGRDTLIAPPSNVHRSIQNGETRLQAYRDGVLWLDWSR